MGISRRLLSGLPFAWFTLQALAGMGRIPVYRVPRTQMAKLPGSNLHGDLSLTNGNEFAYLVQIDIGGQDFMVLLDTGSSDLWVVSSDCMAEDCSGVPKYNKSASLSLADVPFHLNYLMGNVTGVVGSDTVTVGDFQVSSQIFAMANATSGLGLSGTGNSGIMGLAFAAEASIADTTGRTLADNLFSAFNDTSRFFTFKLGRGEDDSSFTIGELDPTYVSSTADLTLHPVFPSGGSLFDYWKLPLQSLTINGTAFSLSKSRVRGAAAPIAVLDTGTTLALGPTDDVARFWQSVGGARRTDRGWEVPCNRAVAVGLVIGEGSNQKEYALDPADISWKEGSVDDGTWCLGGLQGNDGVFSADWLLGDTFLRNVYVTHHAATDTQPPAIGLHGLTDPAAALVAFTRDRGTDTSPPGDIRSRAPSSGMLSGGDICGIATAGGFLAGVIVVVVVYSLCGCRKK
ncbi:acid protease [Daedaleopsis nitida]|nr:acid protease [Daedaleopsis nitida]